MLDIIGASLVAYIEREIANHEPEIQALVIAQLDKLATLIFDYVQQKMADALPSKTEDEPQQLPED